MTYIAVDSDIYWFIHISDTHIRMSHAKIVKIRIHRADGTPRMCSRSRRVETVVWGQRETRVDPIQATCIVRFPLCMIAFINYVPHRKRSSTETNILVMFREITVACFMITGCRHEVDRNCVLLGYYAEGNDNLLPTFRDSLSVPSSGVKMGPISCPETSAGNYHCPLHNNPEERSSDLLRGGSLNSSSTQQLFP